MRLPILALVMATALVGGCANQPNDEIMAGANQAQLRSYQTRVFDTNDELMMLRAIIATLQDLGFIIDQADDELGVVTGTKVDGYELRMTVVTRHRGDSQLTVRANAYYDVHPIEKPEPYQDFFYSLERSLYLTAHELD